MGKEITVDPILVHQPAPGFMKEFYVNSFSKYARLKGSMPEVTGYSLRGNKLSQVLQCHELRSTMFLT